MSCGGIAKITGSGWPHKPCTFKLCQCPLLRSVSLMDTAVWHSIFTNTEFGRRNLLLVIIVQHSVDSMDLVVVYLGVIFRFGSGPEAVLFWVIEGLLLSPTRGLCCFLTWCDLHSSVWYSDVLLKIHVLHNGLVRFLICGVLEFDLIIISLFFRPAYWFLGSLKDMYGFLKNYYLKLFV